MIELKTRGLQCKLLNNYSKLKVAAHSASNMFSKFKNVIVNLVFSALGLCSGNFFLIAPFSDHYLPLP